MKSLVDAPSLCDSSSCLGCGGVKKYRGRESPSLICCGDCWKKIPADLRERFLTDDARLADDPHGATISEREVALFLAGIARRARRTV